MATAEKGYTSLEVHINATGGHSSMPPIDGSALATNVAKFVSALERRPPPLQLQSPVTDMLKGMARHAPLWLRPALRHVDVWPLSTLATRVLASLSRETAALVRMTVAVTGMEAFVADNVLPPLGTLNINLRTLPGSAGEATARAYLEGALQAAGLQGKVVRSSRTQFGNPPSAISPVDSDYYQLLRQAIQELWRFDGQPVEVLPYLLSGGTDSKHYARLSRHGILRFNPYALNKSAGEMAIHTANEHVSAENFRLGICSFRRIIELMGDKE